MFGLNYLLLGHHPDIEFTTPLSFEECRKRLSQELQRKREIFGFTSPPPVVERLKGNRFLISRNQSFFYRDNFLVLDGQLESTKDGTVVRASFRLYGGTAIILISGFVLFFGLAANDVISNGAEIGVLFIPVVFWCFLGLMIWLIWWVPKRKREGLADYLRNILMPVGNSSS